MRKKSRPRLGRAVRGGSGERSCRTRWPCDPFVRHDARARDPRERAGSLPSEMLEAPGPVRRGAAEPPRSPAQRVCDHRRVPPTSSPLDVHRRQRRGLPARRPRPRPGRAALRAGAARGRRAGAHDDARRQPPRRRRARRPPRRDQDDGLRRPPRRGRAAVQPRLRQRARAAGLPRRARRGLLPRPLHDRRLGVGGRRRPGELGPRVRARRRDLGLLGLRARDPQPRLAGAGRPRAAADRRAAAGGRPLRPAPARRLHVPLPLRLLLDARAQEPARPRRGVRARVRARRGAAPRPEEPQRRLQAREARAAARGDRRPARHPHRRPLPLGPGHGRAHAARRLLRLAAPRGGLRADARRVDGARQAGHRDGLLGEPRLHDRRELLPRAPHRDRGRPRGRELPVAGNVGRARPRARRAAHARGLGAPGRGARARRPRAARHRRALLAGGRRRGRAARA